MMNRWIGSCVLALAVLCALILPGTADAAAKALVPLPSEASGASASVLERDEENNSFSQTYEDATPDTFLYLIKLMNFCGFAGNELNVDGVDGFYAVYHLASDTYVIVTYYEQDHKAYVHLSGDDEILGDDEIDELIEYYTQDLALPEQPGSNIFPQFYASIGRVGADRNYMIGEADFLPFDGAECWAEDYYDVEPSKVLKYLSDMVLCGFEVSASFGGSMDDVERVIYDFNNGDAEVVVIYETDDHSASVL